MLSDVFEQLGTYVGSLPLSIYTDDANHTCSFSHCHLYFNLLDDLPRVQNACIAHDLCFGDTKVLPA